jgi:hypothetical protein
MKLCRLALSVLVLATVLPAVGSDNAPKPTAREALQALNDLIGSWRGAGEPNGTREEKQKGFWQETISWEWRLKGDDARLVATIDKGKHYSGAELRYLPDKAVYQMTVQTAAKDALTFTGTLKDRRLTLERTDEARKETQRLVLSLLHANRYLYRLEVGPADHKVLTPVFQVGATKEGVPFAAEGDKPECVVSGGLGTSTVSYNGKTYYVCCSGCRDAFKEEPDKYVKEFEEKKRAKKKD